MSIKRKVREGQSIIEVIVAVSVLVIILSGVMMAVLGSFSSTRLAEEESKAVNILTETENAVISIRNRDWNNLVDGTHGLLFSGGVWSFSGASNVVDAKYIRYVVVSSANRDGAGNIVSLGGTVDGSTKKIVSHVEWRFTRGRYNQLETTTYLTSWQLGKAATVGAGATPTPTAIPPTATPTPIPGMTCQQYCVGLGGYTVGTCRQNAQQCGASSEFHQIGGDALCTGGANADTCCCL